MGHETEPGDAAADFAAHWQTANEGGAQVEITTDTDGGIVDIGPTIYPEGQGEK